MITGTVMEVKQNKNATGEHKARVYYRLPGKNERLVISGTAQFFTSNQVINSGKNGFAIAPFDATAPFCWIEAEQAISYQETLPEMAALYLHDYTASTQQQQSRNEYLASVQQIIGSIKAGEAEKVVLSRQIHLNLVKSISLPVLFNVLCTMYQDAFVYVAEIPQYGVWAGATPETLLQAEGNDISTMALAGTRRQDATGEWPAKDIEEHEYVNRHIYETLVTSGCFQVMKSPTHEIQAGHARHLRTGFCASCQAERVAEIAAALHPTPAVCGLPVDSAAAIIKKVEKYNRLLYTGYLGPVEAGKISLFVNLRCMQLFSNMAVLYAGGGIVAGSNPETEWDETILKSTTMLAAIEKLMNLAG